LPTPPISANSTPTMTAAATGKSPPIPGMTLEPSAASTPARRIHLYNHSARSFKASKHKRTVIVHSDEDLNPLRPCGACNEWLKKIAESNPYFQILTFTDAQCNGVYCTPCEE